MRQSLRDILERTSDRGGDSDEETCSITLDDLEIEESKEFETSTNNGSSSARLQMQEHLETLEKKMDSVDKRREAKNRRRPGLLDVDSRHLTRDRMSKSNLVSNEKKSELKRSQSFRMKLLQKRPSRRRLLDLRDVLGKDSLRMMKEKRDEAK